MFELSSKNVQKSFVIVSRGPALFSKVSHQLFVPVVVQRSTVMRLILMIIPDQSMYLWEISRTAGAKCENQN